MHLADVSRNFWGGHAIVGAHLPLAAGMALADKYRGSDAVTICIFGDGATNIGYFHEALNLSKVWQLPVLVGLREQPVRHGHGRRPGLGRQPDPPEGRRATACRTPGSTGWTCLPCGRRRSRPWPPCAATGPSCWRSITYRFRGHSMGDPERYRTSDEVQRWQEDDPIGIFRRHLLEHKRVSTDAELDAEEQQVEERSRRTPSRFAEESPEPGAGGCCSRDIYVDAGEVSRWRS